MSVAGIMSSLSSYISQTSSTGPKTIQQDFQQLGQDLQSGDLSAAQTDFTTLQSAQAQSSSSTASSPTSPSSALASEFTQLGQDLQSGNLSAAQSDFSTIQQTAQTQGLSGPHPAGGGHHHHHPSSSTNSADGTSSTDPEDITDLLSQLGQSLQSGNLSSAQQTYSSLQTEFSQFAQMFSTQAQTGSSSSLSLNA